MIYRACLAPHWWRTGHCSLTESDAQVEMVDAVEMVDDISSLLGAALVANGALLLESNPIANDKARAQLRVG
jgi:hypothetical protein